MNLSELDPQDLLDVGLAIFALGLAVGIAVLVLGKTTSDARHKEQHAKGPPQQGSVPPQRHQNTTTVAAR